MTIHTKIDAQRRDIALEITTKILTELERGVMPWRKPWDGARTGLALPRRATAENYRGVNVIMLWSAAVAKGYASPYWITLRQANQTGAHVRKGERGEMVVYYGQAKKTRDNGAGEQVEDSFRFLKFFTAFNAEQIEGLPERFFPAQTEAEILPIAKHEAWFAKLDIKRILTQDIACYIPSKDMIGMPPLAAFDSADHYAATLNHEAVHATGAAHRVGRDMSKRFSAHALAAEELVALSGHSVPTRQHNRFPYALTCRVHSKAAGAPARGWRRTPWRAPGGSKLRRFVQAPGRGLGRVCKWLLWICGEAVSNDHATGDAFAR